MKSQIIEQIKNQKLLRFNILELEDSLRKKPVYDRFGYLHFVRCIYELEQEGAIRVVAKHKHTTNAKNPPLPLLWTRVEEKLESVWPESFFMKCYAVGLRMDEYVKNPAKQTDADKSDIERIISFIEEKHKFEEVYSSERQYHLFGNEKYLTEEGPQPKLLQRLRIGHQDLLSIEESEPLSYIYSPIVRNNDVKTALVIENKATFYSVVNWMQEHTKLWSIPLEIVVYGRGAQIESSLSQLRFVPSIETIYYAGDIDPSGISIFSRLQHRYTAYTIKLAQPLYQKMMYYGKACPVEKEQVWKEEDIVGFLAQFDDPTLSEEINQLLRKKMRVAQESLSKAIIPQEVWSC
ncbi:hypothetical protein D3C74_99880 [compost metagenome]